MKLATGVTLANLKDKKLLFMQHLNIHHLD